MITTIYLAKICQTLAQLHCQLCKKI